MSTNACLFTPYCTCEWCNNIFWRLFRFINFRNWSYIRYPYGRCRQLWTTCIGSPMWRCSWCDGRCGVVRRTTCCIRPTSSVRGCNWWYRWCCGQVITIIISNGCHRRRTTILSIFIGGEDIQEGRMGCGYWIGWQTFTKFVLWKFNQINGALLRLDRQFVCVHRCYRWRRRTTTIHRSKWWWSFRSCGSYRGWRRRRHLSSAGSSGPISVLNSLALGGKLAERVSKH